MSWTNKRGMPELKREIITIDADNKVVGRLATHIAKLLMGKEKAGYTPHIDSGAVIKVINASKLVFTGKKLEQKNIFRSSNRPGGVKATNVGKLLQENPDVVLRHAVKYMLPKNRTQADRLARLVITA